MPRLRKTYAGYVAGETGNTQRLKNELGMHLNNSVIDPLSIEDLKKMKKSKNSKQEQHYKITMICKHIIDRPDERVGRFTSTDISETNNSEREALLKGKLFGHTPEDVERIKKKAMNELNERQLMFKLYVEPDLIGQFDIYEFCTTIITHSNNIRIISRFNDIKHRDNFLKFLRNSKERKTINKEINLLNNNYKTTVQLGVDGEYHYVIQIESYIPKRKSIHRGGKKSKKNKEKKHTKKNKRKHKTKKNKKKN